MNSTSYQFSCAGLLPWWGSLLVGAAALGLVLFLVRAELRRLRRPGRAWLYVTRTLILLCLAWLLAQPALFIRTEKTESGRLVLVLDDSQSMFLADAYRDLSTRMDLAEQVGVRSAAGRSLDARAWAQELRRQVEGASRLIDRSRRHLEELEQGLPWGESFTSALKEIGDTTRSWDEAAGEHARRMGPLRSVLMPTEEGGQESPWASAFRRVDDFVRGCEALAVRLADWFESPAREPAALAELVDALANLKDAMVSARDALDEIQRAADENFITQGPPETGRDIDQAVSISRFQLVTRTLSQPGLLARLSAKHRVEIVRSKDLAPLWADGVWHDMSPDDAAPNTDLMAPIDGLLDRYALEPVSGIVLFSDGQQNSPARTDTLERLAKHRIPLLCVGVGSPELAPDAAIAHYDLPRIALAESRTSVPLTLKTAMPGGLPVTVRLMHQGAELARAVHTSNGDPTATVELSFIVPEPGTYPLRLAVEWEGSDANPENNAVVAPLYVPRTRPSVLVITPFMRWDMTHLWRVLERSPCRTDVVLTGEGKGRPPMGGDKGQIPDTLLGLQRYELVVLDGPPFEGFSQEDRTLFREYVTRAGGSILFSGSPGGPEAVSLSRRQPVGSPDTIEADPEERAGDTEAARGLSVAEDARFLPVVLLSPDSEENRAWWARLHGPRRLFSIAPPAVSLLQRGPQGVPCLGMDFWGRGRTYHLGAYDLFRMREWFGANTVNRLLRSLVDDAVTPLLPGPDTAAQMAVYPSLLTTGQKSHVLVYIPKGSAARTQVLLEPEGAAVQALETVPLDGDGRLWHTTLVPVRPGVLKLQAKSGDQKLELAATVTRPLSREHIYFHLDEAGLRRIADSAQGRYAPVSQTVDALENIPARTYSRVSVREVRLWNVTWVLLFLAGLLTVDWVLRRRFGIVL